MKLKNNCQSILELIKSSIDNVIVGLPALKYKTEVIHTHTRIHRRNAGVATLSVKVNRALTVAVTL